EPAAPERMLDPTDPRYEVAPLEEFVDVVEEAVEQAPVIEDLDLDLGEVDLGSLLVQSQSEDDTGPSDRPDTAGTDTEADETLGRSEDAAPRPAWPCPTWAPVAPPGSWSRPSRTLSQRGRWTM